jgi:3-hydroxyisobutyrate dehydrogenase-like beta-hydroxyacid dehydrogenase
MNTKEPTAMTRFAIIGFGEVGGIFARDLRAGGADAIHVFDVSEAARQRAVDAGATVHASAAEAAAQADVIFVPVTAGSALVAAQSLAGGLAHAPYVVDVNSVSPGTKQSAAQAVTEVGGRYVEAAVMASVPPKGLRSPILLGGPDAEAFKALMAPFGMDMTIYPGPIGKASAVKMCRSVMVKGLEALTTECMLAARHYGVEQDVLRSLSDTLPHEDWRGLARYVISRALIHGKRRAEEMREVARTVQEAGVDPLLSAPIAERQDWAAARGRAMTQAQLATTDLETLLAGVEAATPRRAAAE